MKPLVHLIVGARPNFVKAAPVYRELKKQEVVEFRVVYTMQHQKLRMGLDFANGLGLPTEGEFMNQTKTIGGIEQTTSIMNQYSRILDSKRPDWAIVFGDVNSTLACGYVAKVKGVKLAHIEAGLRCSNMLMTEELNRRAIDSISDFCWTTLKSAHANLLNEGKNPANLSFVGNTMIDTMKYLEEFIDASKVHDENLIEPDAYILVTLHRRENVDDLTILAKIVENLTNLSKYFKIVFPCHNRTFSRLKEGKFLQVLGKCSNITLLGPQNYIDFICLMKKSMLVVTDSGGVQEEATYLGIPSLVLRNETERPETLDAGLSQLVQPETLIDSAEETLSARKLNPAKRTVIPFWDGKAANRIVRDIRELW